jgi:hypothetical protein
VATRSSRADWGSALAGLASVATVPVAVYATRFSDSYDLLHAGMAIPVGVALAVVALALARHAERSSSVRLAAASGRNRLAATGRILAIAGLCVAAAALVALGVYGLLEYVGSRE